MITMNELFSGIGAQTTALKRLGIEHKVVGISDIDKYANQSYMAIHGQTHQYGDISKVERLDYADLWTYSFPCQDLSVAGKQAGIKEGTRSGLLMEVERLLTTAVIEGNAPKFLLLENVKNLVGKKFKPDFDKWLETLDALGYRNYWQVLNAKNYGVPQNRERVFVMSIRKDIESDYKFPEPVVLTKRLKDVLEPQVDEKYYLPDKWIKRLPFQLKKQYSTLDADVAGTETARQYANWNGNFVSEPKVINPLAGKSDYGWHFEQEVYDEKGIARAVKAGGGSGNIPKVMQEPMNLYPNSGNPQAGRVYNSNGISPAMDTCQGGNRMPKITEVIGSTQKNAFHGDGTISPSLTSAMGMGGGQIPMCKYENYRIRKLTPKECWRLMGFTDEEFDAAQASGVSNSQLYKQAGNSIVVDVLVGIFKQLFINGGI